MTSKQELHMRSKGFLTVKLCARLMLVTESAIYAAITDGRLPSTRVGGRVYVKATDFSAFSGIEDVELEREA